MWLSGEEPKRCAKCKKANWNRVREEAGVEKLGKPVVPVEVKVAAKGELEKQKTADGGAAVEGETIEERLRRKLGPVPQYEKRTGVTVSDAAFSALKPKK